MDEKEKNSFIDFREFISGFTQKTPEVTGKDTAKEDSAGEVDLYKQKSIGLNELLKIMVANKASDLFLK